jgi:hypothetical protein
MSGERVQIDYSKLIDYKADDLNQVGAGTDTGLRDIPSPSGTTYHVKKSGTIYGITQITNGVVNTPRTIFGDEIRYRFYSGGYLLGTLQDKNGGSNWVAGGVTSNLNGIRIEITDVTGNPTTVVNGDTLTITTDVDGGGLTVYLPGQTYNGNVFSHNLYLSASGSTYYAETSTDQTMIHGGYRHTPTGTSKYPDIDITTCYARCGANDGVQIDDNEAYEEELDLDTAITYLFSQDGNNPKSTMGVGARITREMSQVYNNSNAVYFNENGNNGTADVDFSWQLPYADITTAIANRGTRNVIYGGVGAGGTGLFTESINIAGITLEPEYGYIPRIKGNITAGSDGAEVRGFEVEGEITMSNVSGNIYDNNIFNSSTGIDVSNIAVETWNIKHNKIYNCEKGIQFRNGADCTFNFDKNNIYSNTKGIEHVNVTSPDNFTINIENSIFYNNSIGIEYDPSNATVSGYIRNCIFYNNSTYGIDIASTGTLNEVINDNIFLTNVFAIESVTAKTISYCNFYNNTTDYDASITSNNEIAGDPKFCKITSPYQWGLSADSPCYRADVGSDDIGMIRRIIEINNDSIEINGIEIDGQDEYNNAIYIADSADHTGTIIKWCNVFDFQGIQIDPYDDDTDTDCIISNNKIYNGGNGIKLSYGGNTLEENLIYNNTLFGIWSDYTGQAFNHNTFFNNQYGLYLESNSGSISIKNCIFYQNSLYGIFSEVSVILTYCCIKNNSYNDNVDVSDGSNKIDNPMFISTVSGSEDLHVMTVEQDYIVNSVCKEAADDGYDIGAYLVDYGINALDWKKYNLAFNPRTNNEGFIPKGAIDVEDGVGNISNWAKSHRIILPFSWSSDSATSQEQRLKIRYFASRIPKRENDLKKDDCEFRVHLLPETYYEDTIGTVDATAKTITQPTNRWTEDQMKGWWVTVVFESGTATGTSLQIAQTLKVAPSPAWTIDEWIGYKCYVAGLDALNYDFYITDNNVDTLTLSDVNDYLLNSGSLDWKIVKHFKVSSNTETTLNLIDDDNELISGSYSYFIDFILCRVKKPSFAYSQRTFDYNKDTTKSGYSIVFEEID